MRSRATWTFSEPASTPVSTDERILSSEQWIFFVRHTDGGWEFLPPDHLDGPAQRCRVPLSELVFLDARLLELADLPSEWMAFRQSRADEWVRRPLPVGPTHLLTFDAEPTEEHEQCGEVAGAIVSCFIRCPSDEEAWDKAMATLDSGHWRTVEVLDREIVSRDDFEGTDNLQYYEQAQLDGEVYVFHTFETRSHDE